MATGTARLVDDLRWMGWRIGRLIEDARARGGVWHSNGFVVCTLDAADWGITDGGALRLHLWPAGERVRLASNPPVHDHVWDLASRVIVGRLHERRYEIENDPDGRYEPYWARYGKGRDSVLEPSGRRVRLVRTETIAHEAGSIYTLEAHRLHSSHARRGQLTATLMRTGPVSDESPRVIANAGRPPLGYTRPVVEPARLNELLDELVEELADPVAAENMRIVVERMNALSDEERAELIDRSCAEHQDLEDRLEVRGFWRDRMGEVAAGELEASGTGRWGGEGGPQGSGR